MPHTSADAENTVLDRYPRQFGNAIDVDQMRRLRHAECHDRHQALSASKDTAILRPPLGKQRNGFIHRGRAVVGERGWFHAASFVCPKLARIRAAALFPYCYSLGTSLAHFKFPVRRYTYT